MRTYRIVGAVMAVILGVVLVVSMVQAFSAQPAPARGGDMLGQDNSETFSEYEQRAEATVAQAPADEFVYGLITFAEPLSPMEAGAVTEDLTRVNAMVVGMAAPMSLPEPIEGEQREDVYARQLDTVETGLAGVGNVPAPEDLNAVVAYDTGDAFRNVDKHHAVATVEVLPADAAWGWFGVSPVRVPGVAPTAGF